MKNLLEFKLDNGESAFIQIGETQARRGNEEASQAERRFTQAIRAIAPVGNALLTTLKDINTPDEIKLEFGLTFGAAAGAIFTSVESEASFKVSITWKNHQ